ncbi:MAG TPA: hypothetical protein DEG44_03950 [Candidatus Kerfeldbacteria bacterium]|nr:hypothetical protein [Candidatus Kerfeldbacteria bacterium]
MPAHTTVRTQPQPQLVRGTPFVLGIDAGATKTAASTGQHIGYSGPGNIHTTKPDDLIKHLREAVLKTNTVASSFRSVVVGMAGVDSPHDQIRAEQLVKKALAKWLRPQTRLTVVNDIHIVRRSGSADPYGIALIAGTGSHCFGINHHGDIAYAGGLEYLLSDEGSGYDMGIKVLRAAVRSADGRTKPTQLATAVLQHFKVRSVRSLEPIVYHGQRLDKSKIAKLAKLVDALAKTDWRAKEIMAETQTELVLHVAAVVQRLHMKQLPFDLVVAGGVFDISSVPFLKQFSTKVKYFAPRCSVIKPSHPPVWGAVRLAQDQL